MILLIDNYDSFVFNLARYFQRLGQVTKVVRNDQIDVAGVRRLRPSAMVLSPGPCGPEQAGRSLQIVQEFWHSHPILGVCLGHQTIAAAFGSRITRAPEPMHGRVSQVHHDQRGVFSSLPNPLKASRYHSLVVDKETLPDCLEISAETADGIIMGIRHRQRPLVGLQFHPESILTEYGYPLLANFLSLAGSDHPPCFPSIHDELRQQKPQSTRLPDAPVTF